MRSGRGRSRLGRKGLLKEVKKRRRGRERRQERKSRLDGVY